MDQVHHTNGSRALARQPQEHLIAMIRAIPAKYRRASLRRLLRLGNISEATYHSRMREIMTIGL